MKYPESYEPMELGERAAEMLRDWYGPPKVTSPSASGYAVHFGEFAQFVPGTQADRHLLLIGRRIEELACAYLAYREATKHEGDEVS